ncbi:MAG: ATP-dependent 6-phosphofructokinase [Nitrospinota bacterium]|nr:MAG: ATP-dependent 6-phosphofructokinase [Nitrospinota bacterium]
MKKIGILTSGGDSPGMNTAVRAVIRSILSRDPSAEVWGIYDGYKGFAEGQWKQMDWKAPRGWLREGGTFLRSARYPLFKEPEVRQRALRRYLEAGFTGLVVIGGDGSLQGAHLLNQESPLTVVGVPASIDNDIAGTDMSIGADTALNTIVESIDHLRDTAESHNRAFVIEVMGRNCGYLALVSGLASGADYIFVPEREGGERFEQFLEMIEILQDRERREQQSSGIIIRAEGVDFSTDYITQTLHLNKVMSKETRPAVLGHIQRGGIPSAYDRLLATRLGDAAGELVVQGMGGVMVGIRSQQVVTTPLAQVITETNRWTKRLSQHMREILDISQRMSYRHKSRRKEYLPSTIGVLLGTDYVPGLYLVLRAMVREGWHRNVTVLGIADGFDGLAAGEGWIHELQWEHLSMRNVLLPTYIKMTASPHFHSEKIGQMVENIQKYGMEGLVIVGDMQTLKHAEELHLALPTPFPILFIPAGFAGPLSLTMRSLGFDTALNQIMRHLDMMVQATAATKRLGFVQLADAETDFLSLLAAIVGGCEQVFIQDYPKDTTRAIADVLESIRQQQRTNATMILTQERSQEIAEIVAQMEDQIKQDATLAQMLSAQGQIAVTDTLKYQQRGGKPTAYDRRLATLYGVAAINQFILMSEEHQSGIQPVVDIQRQANLQEFCQLFERMSLAGSARGAEGT